MQRRKRCSTQTHILAAQPKTRVLLNNRKPESCCATEKQGFLAVCEVVPLKAHDFISAQALDDIPIRQIF